MSCFRYVTTGSLCRALGLLGVIVASGCVEPGHTASSNGETTVVARDAAVPAAAAAASEDKDAGIFQSAAGFYLAAREADSNGDLAKAADFMAEALKRDPDNIDLMRDAFQLKLADGRLDDAKALAERLVAKQPDSQLANAVLALEEARAGRFAESEARMAKLPRTGLGGVLAPLIEGWSLQGEGKTDEALKALDQLSGVRGFGVLHDFHAAFIDEIAGRPAAAEAAFKATMAAESAPSFRVVQAFAEFYARQGRLKEALALFESYRKSNPDTVRIGLTLKALNSGKQPPLHPKDAAEGMAEALFDVGSALRQDQGSRLALGLMRLALYMQPSLTIASMTLGDMLEGERRDEEALAIYRGIAADSPLHFSAQLRIADVLREGDKLDEAIKVLEALAAEWPDSFEPLATEGDYLRSAERFADAAKAYDLALARVKTVDTQDWSLFYARGVAFERAGEWPQAEKDFLEALKLSPDQPSVLNYLGYSWVDRGENLPKAKEFIERAVQLKPDDGYIVDSLGWVLYRQGDYQGAVSNLERAVELRPDDPVINDHLGDAYWRVGRLDEARFQWKRALTLKPEPDLVTTIGDKLQHGLKATGKTGERDGSGKTGEHDS